MGTRGLVGFYSEGVTKATYNHYDSYPEGVGKDILQEVKQFVATMDEHDSLTEELKDVFESIRLVKEETKPTDEEIKKYVQFIGDRSINLLEYGHNIREWYSLLRDFQGTIKHYLDKKIDIMIDSANFIKDSLFCEWAYLVNIDDLTLEVWRGFQEKPTKGNRYGTRNAYPKKSLRSNEKFEYYPCMLLVKFPLNDLPKEEDFLETIETKRKETEDDD